MSEESAWAKVDQLEDAIQRVVDEVHDWPAADFWHREAILRAIKGVVACTCSEVWIGHPNPHALTCPQHVR